MRCGIAAVHTPQMPRNAQGGLRLETWEDFAREGYQVSVTCWACGRYHVAVDVDRLAAEAAAGQRSPVAIPMRFRCTRCGGAGEATIIPPGPFQHRRD